MKKRKLTILSFITVSILLILCSFYPSDINSLCDAPLVGGHTGAPGETNCTGCHSDVNNAGPGTVTFNFGGSNFYIPGQIYTCTVTIAQTGIDKMGFACVALKDAGNTTIGAFSLTMPTRTRLYVDGIRNYVSHTPCGADAITLGNNQWTFNWQAPATNVGNITLYIGALCTNHNHAITGDNAYTASLQLSPSATLVKNTYATFDEVKFFPNPANDFLEISYLNLRENEIKISIFDIEGRLIKILASEKQSAGKQNLKINLRNEIVAPGVYLIKLEGEDCSITKRVTIL